MRDWNVVVTVRGRRFRDAAEFLQGAGGVQKTGYFNVLAMRVDDPAAFLDKMETALAAAPAARDWFARILPVTAGFEFQSAPEFESGAKSAVEHWLDPLAGTSFHVRMHRRGFKGRLSSQEEERLLDQWLMEALARRGESARITFEDPDFILAIETIGQRAGLSLWSREQMARHPLLKLD